MSDDGSTTNDPYNGPQNSPGRFYHFQHHGTREERQFYLYENAERIRYLKERIRLMAQKDARLRQTEIEYIERDGSRAAVMQLRHEVAQAHAAIQKMVHEVRQRQAIQRSLERRH